MQRASIKGAIVVSIVLLLRPALGLEAADPCAGEQPLRFATYRTYPVGSGDETRVASFVVRDLDGDGLEDIAATCGAPTEISILPGMGNRLFGPRVNIPIDFYMGYEILAEDLDSDGDRDLVVFDAVSFIPVPPQAGVVVFLNQGGFRFELSRRHTVPGKAWQLVPLDFSGNGAIDLALPLLDESEIALLRNRGDGSFEDAPRVSTLPLGHLRRVAAGDLDGDGRVDLVVTGATDRWLVGVMRGRGGGEFEPPVLYEAGPVPVSVEIADLDRDGDLDVMAASADSVGVGILLNDGAGRFPVVRLLGGAYGPAPARLGDFDGDGWLDIYATGGVFYFGEGGGEFTGPVLFGNGARGSRVHIASDLDRDGYTDLIRGHIKDRGVGDELLVMYSRGDRTFESSRIYATEPVPNSLTRWVPIALRSGDVDGDGDPDLVVANQTQGSPVDNVIMVYKNSGTGRFDDWAGYWVPEVSQYDMVLADLDEDGDLDAVGGGIDGTQGKVCVLFNAGDGSYQRAEVYGFPHDSWETDPARILGYPRRLAVADLDSDGDPDLATVNGHYWTLTVLWNEGGGGFAELDRLEMPESGWYHKASGFAAGDLDGDGKSDLAVLHFNGRLTLLLQRAPREFELREVLEYGKGAASLSAGDMNGDGRTDLVAGLNGDWRGPGFVSVLLARGAGDFEEIDRRVVLPPAASLWDLDRDGDLDVVATGSLLPFVDVRVDRVALFLNRGDGRLGGLVEIPCENDTVGAVARDLSGDGMVDLAVANAGSHELAIHLNEAEGLEPGPPCDRVPFRRGDADASGSLDITDAVRLLGFLFAGEGALACQKSGDADDDGALRVTDAVYLLGYLFRGGSPPPPPLGACGEDPSEDDLDCELYPTCR